MLPFARLLARDPRVPNELLAPLNAIDPEERFPIDVVHELLAGAIHITGDPDLGLKAAREIVPGEYGVMEYAARSAATWREACESVGRYMHLLNDALRFSLHVDGAKVFIELDSRVCFPRASADFQSASLHLGGSYLWYDGFSPEYEVWFTHPKPADTREYERTFEGGTLYFGAPSNGFVCSSKYLDLRLQSADPHLHALIRKQAEMMLAELPSTHNITERVRDLLVQSMAGGTPSLTHVARRVSMSERTLTRHLEAEGTSFKALLDDLRQRMAMRYVRQAELCLSEIAFLLGFSQVSAFHRAFRRWTGQTPNEFRATTAPAARS